MSRFFATSLLLLIAHTAAAAPEPRIHDRLLPFDADRAELVLKYRRLHEDPRADSTEIRPRVIVLHHTATATLDATLRTFEARTVDRRRKALVREGLLNVSAHFVIDRDGTIYRLVPETRFARHCIGLNHLAIGIENVGGGPQHPLTEAQIEASARLVRWLAGRHEITHLIGHHEYRRMEGHRYFRERRAAYRTVKIDPGDEVMAAVRARLVDLALEGPPR